MIISLFLIIIVAILIFVNLLWRHNGKKQIWNIDMVQFLYAFVLSPLAFVLLKTFLFYVLRHESNLGLSIGNLFIIDTAFSVLAVYLIVAVAIHSITKSFSIHRTQDPLLDIFHISEYFHLWWSHILMWVGGLILQTFFSVANLLFPIQIPKNSQMVFPVLILGFWAGMLWYFGILNSDPRQEKRNFLKLMKLCIAGFFSFHAAIYLLINPLFSLQLGLYWFVLASSFGMVIASLIFEKSKKATAWRERLLHEGWGENIQLFIKEKLKK